jgi:hypothetical protein
MISLMHRDPTSQSLHDAHELRGAPIAGRHEVDDPRRAVGGLEVGLQDQRPLAVAARHAADLPGGGDKPAPMPLLSQQRGKARYAARYTHLTTREHNKLRPTQAQTVIAAAILRHLHAVITTGQRWDPLLATHGTRPVHPTMIAA